MPTPIQQLPRASLIALMMAVVTNAAVAQDSASGPDTLSETYRDWIVGCRTVASQGNQPGARLCEMTQELRQQDGGQRSRACAMCGRQRMKDVFCVSGATGNDRICRVHFIPIWSTRFGSDHAT